jgi:glutamine amidotransferase
VGADARLTADRREIEEADGVVLPGVGAFGACMRALGDAGLTGLARDAALDDRPFLGICVGMQMLYEGSDESPDDPGLGVLPGRVARLPAGRPLPQMGWNTLSVRDGSALFAGFDDPIWVYFVHTYATLETEPASVAATASYGVDFVAAVEQGTIWATQFHPEKSSETGLAVLARFVAACAPAQRSS